MLRLDIPGWPPLSIRHLVLDMNGTIATDGALLDGVAERLAQISETLAVHIATADTHGTLAALHGQLAVVTLRLADHEPGGPQKARYVDRLGPETVIAVGNGANDAAMLERAAIGVAVIGAEGAAGTAIAAADVVTLSVLDALDLVRSPRRLVATLRR